MEPSKNDAVCIGSANASPIEVCGGHEAYMNDLEAHRLAPPLDTIEDYDHDVDSILDPQGQGNVRDRLDSWIEDLEELNRPFDLSNGGLRPARGSAHGWNG